MSFLDIQSPLPTGERGPAPVNKFSVFMDNYLEQMDKSPTAQAGETAGIIIDEARDNTPVMKEDRRLSVNSRVPGLNIPEGTQEASGNILIENQMKKNLNTAIVQDPQNNGKIAWAGTILGGTQRTVFDPITLGSAFVAAAGGELIGGAALVGSKFLPEIPALAKFFPEITTKLSLTALEGGIFGFVDGLTSGAIESKRKQVEEGEGKTTTEIVKDAINESMITGAGGVVLDVAARGIFKGFKLLKGDFKENPDIDEEIARRDGDEEKKDIQSRVEKIKENHKDAALNNSKESFEHVDKAFDATESAITKFQIARPEHQSINVLSEVEKAMRQGDVPLHEKIQGLALIRKELAELSARNDNILGDADAKDAVLGAKFTERFPGTSVLTKGAPGPLSIIDKEINGYLGKLSQAKVGEDVGSLSSILSDFRLVTPEDFSNFKRVGIAQMEAGRAVDVEPYLNEVVRQNSRTLISKLDETGINRGRVLHAVLDSLDVIKGRQEEIESAIKDSKDALKGAVDPDKRNFFKGLISAGEASQTSILQQRAVHELLATAITDGFKGNTGEEISSYLQNQLSRDAEVEGGYANLLRDLSSEEPEALLARVEEKAEPFTPESKEEIENIKTRKALIKPMVEDAVKCLTGQ